MVDTLRKQPWTPPPDPLPDERRKPGPLYDLAAVQAVADGDHIYLATRRCAEAGERLEWDTDDIAKLFSALRPEDYRNSEWCTSSRGQVADADVYRLYYDPIEGCRGDSSTHQRFYLKFGFRPNDRQLTLWLFSCHPSTNYLRRP